MKQNILCICGHIKKYHHLGVASKRPLCGSCMIIWNINWYHSFKLDNLKYLEQRYEESVKNG